MSPQIAREYTNKGGKTLYDGKKADVFSTGVIAFKLLTQTTPFTQTQLAASPTRSRVDQLIDSTVPRGDLRQLLKAMLRWDEGSRLSIEEVAQHQYLR
jgi:serine/threonine protein kinase